MCDPKYEIVGANGLTPFSVDFKRNNLEHCILCKQKLIVSSDSWP